VCSSDLSRAGCAAEEQERRASEQLTPVKPQAPSLLRKQFTLEQSRRPGNYVLNSHRRPEPRMEDRMPACKDKTSVLSGLTDPCDIPVKGRGREARKRERRPFRRSAA
jgi:hypothetical protein